MCVKGVGVRSFAKRQAGGDRSRAGQGGDDLLGLGPERLGVLERSARGPERHAHPARQEMEMEMEDLLPACRFVELLDAKVLPPSCRS